MKRSYQAKHLFRPVIWIIFLCATVAAGCSNPLGPTIIIEWEDFVTLDQTTYTSLSEGVLRDADTVTNEVVGTVSKKLNDNVTDPDYRPKSGDASYLEKGTQLYRVEGFDPQDLIAVRATQQTGEIQLYVRESFDALPENNFERIIRTEPSSVRVYLWNSPTLLKELKGNEAQKLIDLLQSSVYTPNDSSNESEEPKFYYLVFDTGEPILYRFLLTNEGQAEDEQVRFRNDYIVDGAIKELLPPSF